MTYTSELIGVEACDNDWEADWHCLHFRISDGIDDANSAPFVGDWWLAADPRREEPPAHGPSSPASGSQYISASSGTWKVGHPASRGRQDSEKSSDPSPPITTPGTTSQSGASGAGMRWGWFAEH